MNEEWLRWQPKDGLVRRYALSSIVEDNQGLTIFLADDENERHGLRVAFGCSVDAYRSTYETFRHALIMSLDRKYGSDFYTEWSFFNVNNSHYIQWLREQSEGISALKSHIHFVILTPDAVIEVLATEAPAFSDVQL